MIFSKPLKLPTVLFFWSSTSTLRKKPVPGGLSRCIFHAVEFCGVFISSSGCQSDSWASPLWEHRANPFGLRCGKGGLAAVIIRAFELNLGEGLIWVRAGQSWVPKPVWAKPLPQSPDVVIIYKTNWILALYIYLKDVEAQLLAIVSCLLCSTHNSASPQQEGAGPYLYYFIVDLHFSVHDISISF